MRNLTCFLLTGLALAAPASGQTITRMRSGGGSGLAGGGYSATANLDPAPTFLPPPVTGEPYSGDEVIETNQTLSDGTHITRKIPQLRIYRDSRGRMRVERPILGGPAAARFPAMPPLIEISDPVAGRQCILDVQNQVAHCSDVQVRQPPAGAQPPAPGLMQPPQGPDSLGTQAIDGVTVVGRRSTQYVRGSAIGANRDIAVVMETWTSPELQITMLRKTTDPRSGETAYRIENFSRIEPDPTLFLIPPGYMTKEETGGFSITYSKP